MTRIADWPASERPRERLIAHGAGALTDAELLAVVLGTGAAGVSSLDVARDLLGRHRGLSGLLAEPADRLAGVKGLGATKVAKIKAETEKWQARGVVSLMSGLGHIPAFDVFSIHRSLPKFFMDVRRMPDKIKAATKACMPDMIANAKQAVEASGIKRVGTAASRSSNTFISAKQFEEFVLPGWLEFVWAMADAGNDIVFHCDCDWTRFLPYFKEFPTKRCVLQLDGVTDIFKAKQVLDQHMALHGDVPAPLLTLGTPDQVFDYCKKLIEVIGEGGGFILSSGCSTPHDSKIENVRAMVRAGNELTWR